MRIPLKSRFCAGVLLALSLSPDRLTAQEPPGVQSTAAATQQPPAVPELADLIPLTTILSGRFSSLEKLIAAQGDRSRVEQQLKEISATVDGYIVQFSELKASTDPRVGQLPQLKAEIESVGNILAGVSKVVTTKVRTLGNLRKLWLAEQQQWNAWQTALHKDAPPEEITTTVTKAQGIIDAALGLLLQQLKPLLIVQGQVGTLQTRISTLTAGVEGLLSLNRGGVLIDDSPFIFSAPYFSQLAAALREDIHTGLVQVSWPEKAFFTHQGWIIILQGALALVLALFFTRHRRQLEQGEHWRFVAKRPVAAGILVGVLSAVVFYERPPDIVHLAVSVLVGIAFVRLLEGLVEEGWRRQLVYGLVILLIMTNFFYLRIKPRS